MRRYWTDEEDFLMRELYPDSRQEYLCKVFDRTEKAIYQRATSLGLKKSEAYMLEQNKRWAKRLEETGKTKRFKKGHTPHNKGKEMPEELRQKVAKTFFKKGNLPHNTKYDGHERISKDGYIEVRVRLGRYKPKHHVIWEAVNGSIPKGQVLVFKDGNNRNFDINNIQLITRAELMDRNRIQRYPAEVREIITIFSKIKKAADEKSNGAS